MDSFCGEFSLKLDEKGRMLLPAKFRGAFVEGIAVHLSPDRCLRGTTIPDFEKQLEVLQAKGSSAQANRRRLRTFTATAHKQVPDAQGRVLITQKLRDFANVEREITVIGVGRFIEIWNPDAWAEEQVAAAAELAELDDEGVDFF